MPFLKCFDTSQFDILIDTTLMQFLNANFGSLEAATYILNYYTYQNFIYSQIMKIIKNMFLYNSQITNKDSEQKQKIIKTVSN